MKDSNREAFESWATDKFPIAGLGQFEKHNNGTYLQRSIRNMYEAWQAAKAQAVPDTQALHDRLLVKSIREHVESHISEVSVNDLFDKGWLTAMRCIQNNIDMLEAQDSTND